MSTSARSAGLCRCMGLLSVSPVRVVVHQVRVRHQGELLAPDLQRQPRGTAEQHHKRPQEELERVLLARELGRVLIRERERNTAGRGQCEVTVARVSRGRRHGNVSRAHPSRKRTGRTLLNTRSTRSPYSRSSLVRSDRDAENVGDPLSMSSSAWMPRCTVEREVRHTKNKGTHVGTALHGMARHAVGRDVPRSKCTTGTLPRRRATRQSTPSTATPSPSASRA